MQVGRTGAITPVARSSPSGRRRDRHQASLHNEDEVRRKDVWRGDRCWSGAPAMSSRRWSRWWRRCDRPRRARWSFRRPARCAARPSSAARARRWRAAAGVCLRGAAQAGAAAPGRAARARHRRAGRTHRRPAGRVRAGDPSGGAVRAHRRAPADPRAHGREVGAEPGGGDRRGAQHDPGALHLFPGHPPCRRDDGARPGAPFRQLRGAGAGRRGGAAAGARRRPGRGALGAPLLRGSAQPGRGRGVAG